MGKKLKIVIGILVVLIIAIVILAVMIFNKNGYKIGDSSSISVIDKIAEGEKKGEKVVLSSEELNNIAAVVYKKDKEKGNLTIKTPEIYLENDLMGIKIPVVYKGMEFIVSSMGNVDYKNDNIVFKPNYFKLGKLTLPKGMVFNKLKNFSDEKFIVEDETIKINKKSIPFSMKNLSVKNSELTIEMNKLSLDSLIKNNGNSNEEIKKLKKQLINLKNSNIPKIYKNKIDEAIKNIENGEISKEFLDKIKNEIKDISKVGKITSKNNEVNTNNNKNSNVSKPNNAAKIKALDRVSGELSGAIGSAGPKGQRIIGIMLSTISKMRANPSYNYNQDAGAVKSIYARLKSKERNQVKAAIYSNVSGESMNAIRSTFGI